MRAFWPISTGRERFNTTEESGFPATHVLLARAAAANHHHAGSAFNHRLPIRSGLSRGKASGRRRSAGRGAPTAPPRYSGKSPILAPLAGPGVYLLLGPPRLSRRGESLQGGQRTPRSGNLDEDAGGCRGREGWRFADVASSLGSDLPCNGG